MCMDRKTRIGRIVGLFLSGRFSKRTEERVQRWLIEPRGETEKEAASLRFWESLEAAPTLDRRSWKRVSVRTRPEISRPASAIRRAGIAAAIAVPLMAAAGGYFYYRAVEERQQAAAQEVRIEAEAANKAAPLAFENADLQEIMAALEHRFGVRIEAPKELYYTGRRYTVRFAGGESLTEIFDVLGEMAGFRYTQMGETITITK